jgi:hypothetical protein
MTPLFCVALWIGFGALGHGMCMRHWRSRFGDTKGAAHNILWGALLLGPLSLLTAWAYYNFTKED